MPRSKINPTVIYIEYICPRNRQGYMMDVRYGRDDKPLVECPCGVQHLISAGPRSFIRGGEE